VHTSQLVYYCRHPNFDTGGSILLSEENCKMFLDKGTLIWKACSTMNVISYWQLLLIKSVRN
jgi:hypothetical protein